MKSELPPQLQPSRRPATGEPSQVPKELRFGVNALMTSTITALSSSVAFQQAVTQMYFEPQPSSFMRKPLPPIVMVGSDGLTRTVDHMSTKTVLRSTEQSLTLTKGDNSSLWLGTFVIKKEDGIENINVAQVEVRDDSGEDLNTKVALDKAREFVTDFLQGLQ